MVRMLRDVAMSAAADRGRNAITRSSNHPGLLRLLGRSLLVSSFLFLPIVSSATEAAAKSSGGYSRPGSSARTPSVGGGSGGYRTPSTRSTISGGYSRPAPTPSRPRYQAPSSSGDTSFSRDRSGSALDTFERRREEAVRPRPAPAPEPVRRPRYETETRTAPPVRRPSTRPQPAPAPDRGWYGDRGYRSPSWDFGNRSFGVWDGLFLYTLLSNLDRPGSVGWFHDNQNDPGYQEWRREIEQRAQGDAELRRRIDDLDNQLRERESQPRTPGAVPADVPVEVAKAKPVPSTPPTPIATPVATSGGGGGGVGMWTVLFLLAVVFVGGMAFIMMRRSVGSNSGPVRTSAPAASRRAASEGATGGDPDASTRSFRVGMTVTVDPTPFVLAGAALKATPPGDGGTGRADVAAVGRVVSGSTRLVRLRLAGGSHFVQLHLDAAGDPDECRLFGVVDEIEPADADEWTVWLDAEEGLIGWPEFQTKDGKIYDRVWAQSDARIEPRKLVETVEDLSGTRTVESQAMLYAAATGASDPAPGTEYILVSAVKDGNRAWVEIRAGIDINPATLQLS